MTTNGWIILDKSLGLSSAQGVAAVKRILRGVGIRPDRVGHGGTLDPLATGVLPIAVGEATKLAGRMLDATKGYDFTVQWGAATATEDAEGAVTATSDLDSVVMDGEHTVYCPDVGAQAHVQGRS